MATGDSFPWDLLLAAGTTLGATLLGAVVGGVISRQSYRHQWRLAEQTTACTALLREVSVIYIALATAGRQHQAADPEGGPLVDFQPWQQALHLLNLVAEPDIVEAAHALDAEVWRLHLRIKRLAPLSDHWHEDARPLNEAQLRFVNVARSALRRERTGVGRLNGKPSPTDPIWQDAYWQDERRRRAEPGRQRAS